MHSPAARRATEHAEPRRGSLVMSVGSVHTSVQMAAPRRLPGIPGAFQEIFTVSPEHHWLFFYEGVKDGI